MSNKTIAQIGRRSRFARLGSAVGGSAIGRGGGGLLAPPSVYCSLRAPGGYGRTAAAVGAHTHSHAAILNLVAPADDHTQYARAGASRVGTISIEANSSIDQDLTTDSATAQFATLTLGSELNIGANVNYLGIKFTGGIGTAGRIHAIWPATDNHRLFLAGGAGESDHGGYLYLSGNEFTANTQGFVQIAAGQPGTTGTWDGMIRFLTGGAVAGYFDRSQNLILAANLGIAADADLIQMLAANSAQINGQLYVTGVLKFGTYAVKAAEAFAGYVTITDSGGTPRKLMVCA